MRNRVINNWATTVLAVLIIFYCMYMMYSGTAWQELIGFFGLATLLLRSKDSLIGLPKDETEGEK